MKYKTRYKTLKTVRILSQILFFFTFIYIFYRSLDPFNLIFNPFLKYDPLIFLTHLNKRFIIPVITIIILTLIFGRFFCGWVCPLGTLIDLLDYVLKPIRNIINKKTDIKGARFLKLFNRYPPSWLILGIILITIFTPAAVLQIFHPNIWIIRIFSLSTAGIVFLFVLIIFALILRRFWCRFLCPLGAFYGLLSSISIIKLNISNCSRCKICDQCPMGAADYTKGRIYNHQCILCFDYEYRCPSQGFSYNTKMLKLDYDNSRREFLIKAGYVTAGLALGSINIISANVQETNLLRPPGVTNESDFTKRCLRCFQCVRSCPNGIIKITGIQYGLSSFLTPHLNFHEYGCDYNCQVCQKVCPNYAIPLQSLKEKQHTKIGVAKIDHNLCVVYTKGINCIVCEEFCPVPEKAIELTPKVVTKDNGETLELKLPKVNRDLCIGCGICEANCPVEERAIRVFKHI